MNERKKTQPQKQDLVQHRELVSLLFFDFPNKHYFHFIRMVVKMKKNDFFLLEKNMFANS